MGLHGSAVRGLGMETCPVFSLLGERPAGFSGNTRKVVYLAFLLLHRRPAAPGTGWLDTPCRRGLPKSSRSHAEGIFPRVGRMRTEF